MEAIIGFPVFRELGSVTFSERQIRVGKLRSRRYSTALRAQGDDLFVSVKVAGQNTALRLDTGASKSALLASFAHLHPSVLTGLQAERERIASVGGVTTQSVIHLEHVRLALAGRSVWLSNMPITTSNAPEAPDTTFGTLGRDVLAQFESYTLDLKSMRIILGRAKH
jgi:hypothetical protein